MFEDRTGARTGSQNAFPSSLTISTFTAAHSKEIQAMTKALSEETGTKLAFQRLPRHMRRRAMSHNVKRLPRRLREIYLRQLKKGGLPPKQKRPSRKFRRRPHNLYEDYARRKRRVKWLYTHIWHAKRFHMVEKWGYKLPWCPCDKSFRACYRASAKHCLIQDISYHEVIEIYGTYDDIVNNFKKITDPAIGLTIAAKCYLGGKRAGSVTLFELKTDRKAIGSVNFLWNPKTTNDMHTLWLFVHPAYYNQILEALVACFANNGTKIKELHQELSIFRLTGPLSQAVLDKSLKLLDWTVKDEMAPEWLKKYSRNELVAQNDFWESIRHLPSPSHLSPHTVLALVVQDLRLNIPSKRTKAVSESNANIGDNFNVLPDKLGSSELWNESTRNYLRENKLSNADIAEKRSQLLAPGSVIQKSEQPIPIVLIQRPGTYGSGWDIILPSSYAQSFWISFIMWGARAGGLRETRSVAFEMSRPNLLQPDTLAGRTEENYDTEAGREKFFRLPPNKRTNFNKYGVCSPFSFRWRRLIDEWSDKSEVMEDFKVLRHRETLRQLRDYFSSKAKNAALPPFPANSLVPVELTMLKKGSCKKYSMVCIPETMDYKKEPVEPIRKDKFKKLRIELRKEHKALLKRLNRRRKRARRLGKDVTPADEEALQKYKQKMRQLWLPEHETVRRSCSREIAGFVTHGDFSFASGQVKGIGYMVANSLKSLTTLPFKNRVLVRNTDSRQYRAATLRIICD